MKNSHICMLLAGLACLSSVAEEAKPFNPVAALTVALDAETEAYCRAAAARVPAQGRANVLFLGDSLTDYDRSRNHASIMAHYLEEAHPGAFTVYNYAIGGDFCSRLWNRMNGRETHRLEAFGDIWSRRYDLAFILLGANDSKTSTNNGYKVPVTPPSLQEKFMGQMIAFLKEKGVRRVVLISPAVANWPLCQKITAQREKKRKNCSLFGEPKHLEAFAAVERRLAESTEGVDFLDIYTPMKARPDAYEMTRPGDGVHLVDKGYRFVACRLLDYLSGAAEAALTTDLEKRESVDIPPTGEVRLASEGEIFLRDDLSDASRWGKPMDHDKSIRVTVGADCPEGGKCLEAAGTVTEHRDNAWCVRSVKYPFEPKAERFMLRMQVTSPTIEAGSITPHGRNWGTAIEWFDEKGAPLEVTELYYPIPLMGFATVRAGGKIPPKARGFLVRLGFDGPNIPGGEAVRMRGLVLSYVGDRKVYDRAGEIVSYPRAAGGATVSWDAETPEGTRVRFQYAGAETADALHAAAFRGPDGTANTFYDRPFPVAEKFMRYRAVLEGDGTSTPVLKSVTVGARRDVGFLNRPDRIPPYVRLVNATAPLEDVHFRPELEITDPSTVDWTAVTVKLDGEEATADFRRAGDRLAYAGPERTWAPKLHKVQVVAKDWVGNVHTAEKRFWIGTRPDVPQAELRDDGTVLIDGNPFFPIGIYGVKPCPANGQDWDNAMKGLKEAGFNVVQTYSTPRVKFLDAAAKAGLKVINRPRMPEDWEFESYRSRPEILAWYLGDDTSGHCTPMELRDRMDAMKGADGRRLTCQADGTSSVYRDYAAGTDIFIPEIYPIRGGDAQNVRDGMARVSNNLRLARKSAREAGLTTRSVWALMQQFKGWTNWKRFPTKDELFCSSFSALASGANGIMWYTYSGGPSKFNKNVMNYGAIDDPERWAELKELVSRINEIKDVLLERTPAEQPVVTVKRGPAKDIVDNPSIVTLLKRHAGAVYVIAVNDTPEAVTADLRIPGAAEKGEALWENRAVSAPKGVLSETFAPLAVHVYRFAIADK